MTTTNSRVAPLDIKVGSTVQCWDGRAGHVEKLVVDPGSKRVTHLVVARGVVVPRAVVVPIARVTRVEGDTVVLDMSLDDLKAQPEFAEVDYTAPDPAWAARHGYNHTETLFLMTGSMPIGVALTPAWSGMVAHHTHAGIAGPAVPVSRGTRVTCRDGELGRLDHVLLDPQTGAVRALVVRKGHLLTKDVSVPVGWVESIGEDEITLDADRALLEKLPEYRPARADAQITADVQQALAADARTRGQDIGVNTTEGVVHLNGVVRSEEARQAAGEAARRVAGVWEVKDDGLLSESALARAVSEALLRDPRTTQAVIEVTCLGGSVTLRGQVRTPQEKAAAVEIARAVPGVAAVIDELEVQPDAERKRWPEAAAESWLRGGGAANLLHRS